jgi:hypothetical protein
VVFVIIEFHALHDMIAEPDADIGVRWMLVGVEVVFPRIVSRATE